MVKSKSGGMFKRVRDFFKGSKRHKIDNSPQAKIKSKVNEKASFTAGQTVESLKSGFRNPVPPRSFGEMLQRNSRRIHKDRKPKSNRNHISRATKLKHKQAKKNS